MVAIDEDPRVRLTTNIVGADPDSVTIGTAGAGPVRAVRRRVAPDVRTRARRRARPRGVAARRRAPAPGAADGAGRQVRGQGRAHRHRHVARRAPPDARPARAGGRRLPRRGGRRRPRPDRHRRAVDLPGRAAAGGHSEGGVPAVEEALRDPPDVVSTAASRLPGQSGSVVAAMLAVAAGPVPPRPLLPDGLGVDRHASSSDRGSRRRRGRVGAAGSAATCSGARRSARCRPPTGSA